jgi:hypothetical protein
MSKQVKLQVPMDKDVLERFKERATDLGFDSAQAYIRFLAKAEVDGRKVNFDQDDWGEPPAHVVQKWERELAEHKELKTVGKTKSYSSVDEFMKDLATDEED